MDDSTNSILASIRKMGGYDEYFNPDLIIHINTTFAKLNQIGVGPKDGFYIEDDTATWSDYTDNLVLQHMVKTYMDLQVKLLFDTSTASSYQIDLMKEQSAELEWRLNAVVDFKSS